MNLSADIVNSWMDRMLMEGYELYLMTWKLSGPDACLSFSNILLEIHNRCYCKIFIYMADQVGL